MTEQRRNPFRSEGDAFRLLMAVVAAGAIVVAVAVLTRPLFGALVGLVLAAVGVWRAGTWARWWLSARGEGPEAERFEGDGS